MLTLDDFSNPNLLDYDNGTSGGGGDGFVPVRRSKLARTALRLSGPKYVYNYIEDDISGNTEEEEEGENDDELLIGLSFIDEEDNASADVDESPSIT